ncbi:MAG TPA: carboxypeptidase-like regulatory domain-containing protein [Terriglobia bacterium]|nr:carboxypeptidase-like regulatory domain-containing protein [Terriglobia bacterium]
MRTLAFVALALLLHATSGLRIASGVITGEIRSAEGPAAGVRVSALVIPDAGNAATGASATLASLAETDAAGRFRLEQLPPGNYYVMAGALDYPSYYPGVKTQADARAVTVTIGATVSGINFALARPASVRVSGRVNNYPAGAPAGLVRVNLIPSGAAAGSPLDTPVREDGTFEFPKVLPGRYNARLNPAFAPISTISVQVDDKDISIEPTMGPIQIGRVVVDDGSSLPVSLSAVAAGAPAPNVVAPPAAVRLMRRTIAAAVAAGRGGVSAQSQVTVGADGYFALPAASGEFQLFATLLPFGFYMKSAAFEPVTNQILVTLTTKTPESPPRGVKVSGRITGLASSVAPQRPFVQLQTATTIGAFALATGFGAPGATQQRVGEALILDDGAFEVLNVPPGTVTLNVISPGANPPNQFTMRLEVQQQDIFIEFALSRSAAPPVGSVSPPGVAPPAEPFTIVVPETKQE